MAPCWLWAACSHAETSCRHSCRAIAAEGAAASRPPNHGPFPALSARAISQVTRASNWSAPEELGDARLALARSTCNAKAVSTRSGKMRGSAMSGTTVAAVDDCTLHPQLDLPQPRGERPGLKYTWTCQLCEGDNHVQAHPRRDRRLAALREGRRARYRARALASRTTHRIPRVARLPAAGLRRWGNLRAAVATRVRRRMRQGSREDPVGGRSPGNARKGAVRPGPFDLRHTLGGDPRGSAKEQMRRDRHGFAWAARRQRDAAGQRDAEGPDAFESARDRRALSDLPSA